MEMNDSMIYDMYACTRRYQRQVIRAYRTFVHSTRTFRDPQVNQVRLQGRAGAAEKNALLLP